jgi:hypothetical protein
VRRNAAEIAHAAGSPVRGEGGGGGNPMPVSPRAAAAHGDLGLRIVQLDDGYQQHIGDWASPCPEKFPDGLAELAAEVRALGFTPGIWLAPFLVGSRSAVRRRCVLFGGPF